VKELHIDTASMVGMVITKVTLLGAQEIPKETRHINFNCMRLNQQLYIKKKKKLKLMEMRILWRQWLS